MSELIINYNDKIFVIACDDVNLYRNSKDKLEVGVYYQVRNGTDIEFDGMFYYRILDKTICVEVVSQSWHLKPIAENILTIIGLVLEYTSKDPDYKDVFEYNARLLQ